MDSKHRFSNNERSKLSQKRYIKEINGINTAKEDSGLIADALDSVTNEESEYILERVKRAENDYKSFRPTVAKIPADVPFYKYVKSIPREQQIEVIDKNCDYILEKLKNFNYKMPFADFEHISYCLNRAFTLITFYILPKFVGNTCSDYINRYDKPFTSDAVLERDFLIIKKDIQKTVRDLKKSIRSLKISKIAYCQNKLTDLQHANSFILSHRSQNENCSIYVMWKTKNGEA